MTTSLHIPLASDDVERHNSVALVVPRLRALFDWSADELGLPGLGTLLADPGPTPAYAWDPEEAGVWHPEPSRLARAARRVIPTPPPSSAG